MFTQSGKVLMEITLEQHRAQIGAHNLNIVCPMLIMFLFMFQLAVLITILILFVRACYSNNFNLSQNSFLEHAKRFSQVIVSSI